MIRCLAAENPDWGAPKIHGELQKLGFVVSERSVARYLARVNRRGDPGKRWLAFLQNHREVIVAIAFFTAPTLTFQLLYCFFVIEHSRRKILHCNVTRHPTAGKVESGVGHAQKTPLKGMRFESPQEAQAYLDHWEARWADTRIHGTTKRQVAAMFAEERPALLPLPVEPFRYYQYGERTVHLDGCVEVEAAYYGAPPGWIGRRVSVQWDLRHVRLLNPSTGQLLREHLRQARGGHRIQDQDRPKHTPLGTQQLLCRADHAGEQIGVLCRGMHREQGETAGRRILGVLSLAKKYGVASVDDACAAALEVGSYEYRFVRRYLERQPQLPLSLHQVDPLIRQLTEYRDLIENKTKGE